MNVIFAPNAFKGCMDATQICAVLADVIESREIKTFSLPMGDGGDGTAAIIASYLQASPVNVTACDALGRKCETYYFQHEKTAIIELAEVCGIKRLAPREYDVMNTSTQGFGLVIRKALEQGCHKLILCIGGSASVDAGLGALEALGLKIVKSGNQYGNQLIETKDINADILKKNFKGVECTVLCDVRNPLCGNEGAARIFGPQKGATPLQISLLENKLDYFAALLLSVIGRDVKYLSYGGAAGGVASSFAALLEARLISGASYCLDLSNFKEKLKDVQLVITGEGKIDNQSLSGKIPGVVASICRQNRKPVIAIAGLAEETDKKMFQAIYTLTSYAGDAEESFCHPVSYLRQAAEDIKRYILKLI